MAHVCAYHERYLWKQERGCQDTGEEETLNIAGGPCKMPPLAKTANIRVYCVCAWKPQAFGHSIIHGICLKCLCILIFNHGKNVL